MFFILLFIVTIKMFNLLFMFDVLTAIAPLFLIIFGTAVFQRRKRVDRSWQEVLNAFALYVGLPALIFSALSNATFSFREEMTLVIANSLYLIVGYALAYGIARALRLNRMMTNTLFICFAISNVAYLGIPILTQVYDLSVLPSISLIVAVYLFWIFTVGIGFLERTHAKQRGALKHVVFQLFSNPLLLAVLLGLIFAGSSFHVPFVIQSAIDTLAASVTPVVLVVIGLFLGHSTIGKPKEWIPVFLFSIATLLLLPALFYAGISLAGHQPSDFSLSIIEAGMPLAITPFALADEYHLDKVFIARSIVMSTILSVVTIPFWISLF